MPNDSRRPVAVVTGSSTGIGYAVSQRLARDGFHVVATMRTPANCDLEAWASSEGLSLETAAMDVTSDESVASVFADVLARPGRVEVLVANAGVGGSGGSLESTPLDAYRETMETNFFGVARCVKAVLPTMREGQSGTIVAMSSQAGRLAFPVMSAYVSSKWALEGLMESLAYSVTPFGVRVAIIEPGTILTPIFGKGDLGTHPDYQSAVDVTVGQLVFDLERGSDPSVVADCVSNAISTDAPELRYLVGQGADRNLRVRGSMTDQQYMEISRLSVAEQLAILLDGEI